MRAIWLILQPLAHCFSTLKKFKQLISQLFPERALDRRWEITNEAHSAELAIAISYPTSASGMLHGFIKNAERSTT